MKKYDLRTLEPRDVPRLLELHAEQNQRDGTGYPLPRIFSGRGSFDPDIVLALAIEKSGHLVQGVYFQSRIAEMCLAGCDAAATARLKQETPALRFALRELGIKGVVTHIPKVRLDQLEKPLLSQGFTRTDTTLASFFLDLEDSP